MPLYATMVFRMLRVRFEAHATYFQKKRQGLAKCLLQHLDVHLHNSAKELGCHVQLNKRHHRWSIGPTPQG
jgi:hypothetical protein